jgi:DegV family protein with EDD domain
MTAAVAVITDGAAALPGDRAGIDNVTVVPLRVAIGMAAHEDPPPTMAEVLSAQPDAVHTSGPAPNRYLEAIARCQSGGAVICTVASSLSGSYQAAVQAARRARVPVRVVDTGTAAGGQGLVVLAAARVARTGAALDEVADAAVQCSARVRLVGTVGTLDRLAASGRVSHLTGWAANSLGVHPVFELRAGRIAQLRPAHSRRAAELRMIECVRAGRSRDWGLQVAVLHVLAPERARRVSDLVAREETPALAYTSEFDVAMAAHLGPDVVGLAWWRAPRAVLAT